MRKLNLKAANNRYVCAEGGGGYIGNGSFVANRDVPMIWEEFVEEAFEDGVTLRTNGGFYITAELDGSISTNRTAKGAWEKWYPIDGGYRSVHGNLMELNPVSNDIIATHSTPSGNTAFTVIDLTPPATELSRLHIAGRYFFNEFGARVFINGATDMMLYKRYLDGEDITPILAQRRDCGANCVRVLGMVSWFEYTPQKYGQRYYDEIPAFLDLCARYGLYVYWTVFADTQVVMSNVNDQIRHLDAVVAQLKLRKNAFGELVNEPYTGTNATANPLAFTRPRGIAFSSGSYNDKYGGQVTPPPYWDFHDFHVPRKDGKRVADQCAVTHPNYVQKGMSIFSGESDKFGGPNAYNGQIYLTDPDLSRQMYQTAKGSMSGYIYHTSAGNFSVLWNDVELLCCPFKME